MNRVRKAVVCSMLMACGVVLPVLFHSIPNSGRVLLPMHIPVYLCGLFCGPQYGLICGVFTPVLSMLLTSMPPAAVLGPMMIELGIYGLVSGFMMKRSHNVLLSLVSAMLAGRAAFGLMNALVFHPGQYSFGIWISAAFVTAAPGIVIQLILIPIVMKLLKHCNI